MKRIRYTLVLAMAATGCLGNEIETRTFQLQHLSGDAAAALLEPYVNRSRDGDVGEMSYSNHANAMTIRETRENLDRIALVLEEYDRPQPRVRFRFHLISADGYTEPDPAIDEVESALRELFRFRGYRLDAEAYLSALEGQEAAQDITVADVTYNLMMVVHDIRGGNGRTAIDLAVRLTLHGGAQGVLETSLTVPLDQTVVIGSLRPRRNVLGNDDEGPSAIILAVKPEITQH